LVNPAYFLHINYPWDRIREQFMKKLFLTALIFIFACTSSVTINSQKKDDQTNGDWQADIPQGPSEIQFTQVAGCGEIVTSLTCLEISDCKEITSGNTYYLLMKDAVSSGTCFSVSASNVAVDINGYTVNYAQSSTGIGVDAAWDASDVEVKNGRLIGGKFADSYAVYFPGNNNRVSINTLDISAGGLQTDGIIVGDGNDLAIFNNNIKLDSQKKAPCDHQIGHIHGIMINGREGKVEIHHNSVTGKLMKGIQIGSCGHWDSSSPQLIYQNYIGYESMITDGYAIAMEGNGGICSDGTKIYENKIDQVNGRGIIIAGWNDSYDQGPGNVELYNNDIRVQEGSDCENKTKGETKAVKIRFGSNHVWFHDNYVKAVAGKNVGVDYYPNAQGGTAYGISVSDGGTYGISNLIERNTVEVTTTDQDYEVMALRATGAPNMEATKTIIKDNIFISNQLPVYTSASVLVDEQGNIVLDDQNNPVVLPYYVSFEGNHLVKAANPMPDFKSMWIGDWYSGGLGITILDMTGENGAGLGDLYFNEYNNDTKWDVTQKWTLTVKAVDGSGNPIEKAQVNVASIPFPSENFSGTTNSSGEYSVQLKEKYYSGTYMVDTTEYNPYTVEVTAASNTLTRQITLDQKKEETFIF
jgi:hypothetical protein